MAKTWTDYQRQIADVILRHRADTPAGYSYKAVKEDLPTTSSGKISEIAKALRENNWTIPPKDGQKVPQEQQGGKLVTVSARHPAPVVFTVGKEDIELDPGPLYESYLLYQDMKVRCDLKDGFSSVLLDGVGLLYRVLVLEPKVSEGKVKVEVTDERSTGEGQEEPGAGG